MICSFGCTAVVCHRECLVWLSGLYAVALAYQSALVVISLRVFAQIGGWYWTRCSRSLRLPHSQLLNTSQRKVKHKKFAWLTLFKMWLGLRVDRRQSILLLSLWALHYCWWSSWSFFNWKFLTHVRRFGCLLFPEPIHAISFTAKSRGVEYLLLEVVFLL